MEFRLPAKGEVFEGRYELREVLGRGGFAIVYRAADLSMSRDVALKILAPADGEYNRTVAQRFLREAQVFAGLEDPHTITMYDFGESAEGLLYMVFEHVRGRDLADVLREEGSLNPAVVVHILCQVASALREAHGLGVLHRDIKPANVLAYPYAGDPYRVKLLDFGIAKDVTSEAARITRTGGVVGTPRYMAPEQMVAQPPGPESDIYSLGLVAYELLTGRPAIAGETQREILQAQLAETPLLVPPRCAPPELRSVLERMMARDRKARHQTAGEVLADLRAIARAWRGKTEDAVQPPDVDEEPEPILVASSRQGAARDWRLIALGIAVTVAMVGGVGLALLPRAEPKPPRLVALPMAEPVQQPPSAAERVPPRSAEDQQDLGSSDGCGRPPPFEGAGTMPDTPAGLAIHIPRGYDPQKRHPVVMLFHRSMRDGAKMLHYTELGDVADEAGFIIFSFSSQVPTHWQLGDQVTVRDTLADAATRLCLDPTRLFAVGDAGGATMARHLACAMPLSGYVVAFNSSAEPCEPVVPTARMRIYGRRDKAVPADGGFGCNVFAFGGKQLSAERIDEDWKTVHQCTGKAKPWGEFEGGACRAWDCELAPLISCATDAGHQWPLSEAGKIDVGVEACEVSPPDVAFPYAHAIWRFFEQHGFVLSAQ